MGGILGWIIQMALPKYAPYIIFGIENAGAIRGLIGGAVDIVRRFKAKYPDAKAPDEKQVLDAIAASSSGQAGQPLAIKKVRDWTPDDWQIFWNMGNRPSGQ